MGWALENLGSGECKAIAEGLFRVERDYGGAKLHGFCPVHGDKSSASFVYHYGADWCKCQSCGFGGDLVKLWAEVTGHDHQDIKAFKTEFGEGSDALPREKRARAPASAPKPERPAEIFIPEEILEALPPLPTERLQELIEKRRWTEAAIKKMDLREYLAGGKHSKIAFPIRDAQGKLCNIRLYQPGADRLKMISWYDPKCHICAATWTKKNKAKVCSSCGALPLDYGRTRLYPAPPFWGKGLLWLVEGESDLLCALSHGLSAVTQTAGAGTWPEEFSSEFAGRDVAIAYDADKAGFNGALKAAKSIAEHARSVRVIQWPEWMGGDE